METLKVNKSFSHVLTLVKDASSQDVMLINETSPCMVRFLGKDNLFRTFVLTSVGEEIEVRATKTDDKQDKLEDFSDFLSKCDGTLEEKKKEEVRAKQKEAKENKLAEEQFQARTKGIVIEKSEDSFVERKSKEEKASKKKTTKKKKASKKKTTKKK